MYNIPKEKQYVFVDFFDTVCFRSLHSHQIFCQWAKAMLKVYPLLNMTESILVESREEAIKSLRNVYEEPPYEEVMKRLWSNIGGEKLCNCDGFVSQNLNIDIAIELGCQYANKRLVNFLEKLKRAGKKIYIVSDFYLPQSSYDLFIKALECEKLFDGIYVSECVNKTKWKGTLYQYVLRDLDIEAKECVMIGDSQHADVKMAKSNGIMSFHYFPLRHKIWTNISKLLKLDFGKRIIRKKSSHLYRHTLYEEYIITLYYVVRKLYQVAADDGVRSLAFLSRGGYYLMKLFEEYQLLTVPEEKRISVRYCYNSRKVCMSAEDDMESRKLLTSYLEEFKDGDRLCIVDEGWYNHSQQAITKFTGIDTYGYYIGTRAKESVLHGICERKGLLFDVNLSGKKTRLYGIFCSNCSMYEQILTAPHGSVSEYAEDKCGRIVPILKENEKEEWLYEHCIRDMQGTMLLHLRGLAVWLIDKEIRKEQLARIVLRSLFFANKKRLHFMNLLDANRYDNHTGGKVSSDKGISDVRISLIELFLHPDRYVGMFCKLQRKLTRNRLMMFVYYSVAVCYYVYVRLLSRF